MNIQENIIRGIQELLYQQDYLVIPGFGGFVLKSHSSAHSNTGASLLPPSKKLGFNKQLRQNDGVLLNWLIKELACDHATALTHLEEFADYCNSILNNKRRLSIERLGFFYLDFENNLCFEPRTDVNFLTDSFGLAAVHLKEIPTSYTKIVEPKTKVFIDRPSSLPHSEPVKVPPTILREKFKKSLAYGALALFMVFILGFVITSVGVQGPLKAAFFNQHTKQQYLPIEYASLSLKSVDSDANVLMSTSDNEAILKLDNETQFVVSTSEKALNKPTKVAKRNTNTYFNNNTPYRIVFGCFSIKSNAHKYAQGLEERNYKVSVTKIEGKDMYVVALGGYQNKNEAKSDLQNIKTLFPKAWIKKIP